MKYTNKENTSGTESPEGSSHLSRAREELMMCLDSYLERLEGVIVKDQHISLPEELKKKIAAIAKERNITKSEVIVSLLNTGLENASKESEEDAQDTLDI